MTARADAGVDDCRTKIQRLLEDVLGRPIDWADQNMAFRRCPEWGSFEQARIMARLHAQFGVGRGPDDLSTLTTPDRILAAASGVSTETSREPIADACRIDRDRPSPAADFGLANTVLDETRITDIDPLGSRLRYRGFDVAQLARSATFESVARLLIDGELTLPDDRVRGLIAEGEYLARASSTENIMSYPDFVARFAGLELRNGAESTADDVRRQGWRALGAAVHLVSGRSHRRGDDSLAARIAAGAQPGGDDVAAGLNSLMILQADHGSSAAALAVRTAISAGANLHAAMLAGLVTFGGHRHGGAMSDVVALAESTTDVAALGAAVRARLDRGEPVPGFGHRIYHAVDPRVEPIRRLLLEAEERRRSSWWSTRLRCIRAELGDLERSGAVVNVDFYAGPLLRAYGFAPEQLTALFAVARVAGWVAHGVEQAQRRMLIRPQLSYAGAAPREVEG